MLDFIFRSIGFMALLILAYWAVLLFLLREEIRRTFQLRRKYGYTLCLAWSVATTDCALDRQLRRVKQFRRPL